MIDLKTIPFDPSLNHSLRTKYRPSKLTHIVIHVGEGSFKSVLNTLKNRAAHNRVSAHYLVGREGQIVHLVDNSLAAWHVGNANGFTLGVEHEGFCNNKDWLTNVMFEASAQLVAILCKTYKIPIENVIGHNDPLMHKFGNDHVDPGQYMPWEAYRSRIKEILANG